MVYVYANRTRGCVVVVPWAALALAIGATVRLAMFWGFPRETVTCALAGVAAWWAALARGRFIRRVGAEVVVWTAFRAVRLAAPRTAARIGARGGGLVHIRLIEAVEGEGTDSESVVIDVSRHLESAGLDAPLLTERRIADALAIEFQGLGPDALEPPPRRWFDALTTARREFGVLIGAVGLGSSFMIGPSPPMLLLCCTRAHAVRMPVGEVVITGDVWISEPPGAITVQVWVPKRNCWVRRDVPLARGDRRALDLDRMAIEEPCAREGDPPAWVTAPPRDRPGRTPAPKLE